MSKDIICNECNEVMKMGFIPDFADKVIVRLAWVEGKPAKSFWGTVKNDFQDRENYFITAYRCERCGSIKLFAESGQPAFTY